MSRSSSSTGPTSGVPGESPRPGNNHHNAAQVTAPVWHVLGVEEVNVQVNSVGVEGLTTQQAQRRLAINGPNRLRAAKRESLVETLLEELREPMILLLLATEVVYAVVGGLRDALTIFAVILVVLGVEIYNERRAEGALAPASALVTALNLLIVFRMRTRQCLRFPLWRRKPEGG